MTNQEIFELMDRFERSAIRTLRLSRDGTTLEMSKDAPAAPALTSPAAPAPVAVQSAQPAAAASAPRRNTRVQPVFAAQPLNAARARRARDLKGRAFL